MFPSTIDWMWFENALNRVNIFFSAYVASPGFEWKKKEGRPGMRENLQKSSLWIYWLSMQRAVTVPQSQCKKKMSLFIQRSSFTELVVCVGEKKRRRPSPIWKVLWGKGRRILMRSRFRRTGDELNSCHHSFLVCGFFLSVLWRMGFWNFWNRKKSSRDQLWNRVSFFIFVSSCVAAQENGRAAISP